MHVARTAQPRPVLLEHGFQHLQARPDRELEQLGVRVDEQIDQREVAGRFNTGGTSDCARLLLGGSFSVRLVPWFGHHSCITSSDRAAASIFNSYLDIPRSDPHCCSLVVVSRVANPMRHDEFYKSPRLPLLHVRTGDVHRGAGRNDR
jgi:hypothetical protein